MNHIISDSITVWIALLATVLISYIYWTVARRKYKLRNAVILSLIPISLFLAYAIWTRSLFYALITVALLAEALVTPLYERHVVEFQVNNDIALVMTLAPVLLLWPFNVGIIQASSLGSLYSDTLQSALTLVGLIFTVGIFFLQIQQPSDKENKELIINLLKGFLVLFIILAVIATIGLINSGANVDISLKVLNGRSNLVSSNSISAYIFISTLCVLMGCLLYLINVFSILVNPNRDPNIRSKKW